MTGDDELEDRRQQLLLREALVAVVRGKECGDQIVAG